MKIKIIKDYYKKCQIIKIKVIKIKILKNKITISNQRPKKINIINKIIIYQDLLIIYYI